MTTSLQQLTEATRLLASCKTIEEARYFRDIAEAARVYALMSKLGLEAQNHATEVKLRAERRMGELLATTEKHPGGRPKETSTGAPTGFSLPTLRDMGLTRSDSSRFQQEAAIPDESFEMYVAQTKDARQELTAAGLLRLGREIERGVVETPPLPSGVFDVIYADPPWQYSNSGGLPGQAENHYRTMDYTALAALHLPAADSAALFLWVTNPMLREGLAFGCERKDHPL